MLRNGKPSPAPIPLIEPLTVTLQGEVLKRLNEYREAVFQLSDQGWPDDAKKQNKPDKHRAMYRPQRKRARHGLLDFLCEQGDAQQRANPGSKPQQ